MLRGLAWTAGALVLVTVLKLSAFDYIGPPTPFLLYFAAIIAGAWYGGWRGGLAVSALSAFLGLYFFMPPYRALRPPDVSDWVRIAFFLLEGLVLTAITTWLRAEQARCDRAVLDAKGSLGQLEGVLHGVEDGITVQTTRGGIVYANDAAARLTGFSSADEMVRASPADIVARFELLDPDRDAPFDVSRLPGRRVLQGLPAPECLVRFRMRATGAERVARIRANAVSMEGLAETFAVDVFQDVTEARRQAVGLSNHTLLIARLEDGQLRDLAVEHVDPEKVRLVEEIERRYPQDPREGRGSHEVARTGAPVFAPRIPDEALVAEAVDEHHLELLRRLQLRSYIAVPLLSQGAVTGVLTLAMADSGRQYGQRTSTWPARWPIAWRWP